MKFKKLLHCTGRAPKLGKIGTIGYQLWVDEDDNYKPYIQLIDNDEIGTHTDKGFSVSSVRAYLGEWKHAKKKLTVYDLETGKQSTVDDENNNYFLRAVLKHLLSGDA